MAGIKYTLEQEEWLRSNYRNASSFADLTIAFNQRFNTNRSPQAISDKCGKSLKLNGKPNHSKYGFKKKEQLPIGTIRKSQVGTYIKVMEVPNGSHISGYQQPYWLPLQKKVYQDTYGEIRSGQMICFLDGDTDNFNLDNLYCIDRTISAIMSKNKWWTHDKELTLTAIKWCELYNTLKGFN